LEIEHLVVFVQDIGKGFCQKMNVLSVLHVFKRVPYMGRYARMATWNHYGRITQKRWW